MSKIIDSKTITVAQLPSRCPFKAELVQMVSNPDRATIVVVLTEEYGAKVVFAGYPSLDQVKPVLQQSPTVAYHSERISNPVQVVTLGTLLDSNTARQLFPEQFR